MKEGTKESAAASLGERFYADLPVVSELAEATRAENCAALPDEWHVALCDVRNSTIAIQSGQYKNVNTLGAAAITAVINASGGLDIPFGFEGDGCVVCVPPRLLDATREALAKTRQIATDSFGLDLRVGTVPVADIRDGGFEVYVGRYRVTEHYDQAVFSGGGMAFADSLLKDPRPDNPYAVADSVAPRGSMEGFECRWQDVPSRHGETVSLIVRSLSSDPVLSGALYRLVIAKVGDIYGNPDACHPLSVPELAFSFDGKQLANEAGIRAADKGAWGKFLWRMRMRWFALLGAFLMKQGIKTEETDWGRYKQTLVRNSDVRKFNDGYRQILAGNAAQRKELDAWLEERYRMGELVYGIHTSNRAQMTCLIFNYAGKHVHFIDGADGGLYLAAKEFKRRLAEVKARIQEA